MKRCLTKDGKHTFYVDDDDYDETVKYIWTYNNGGYITSKRKGKIFRLHRVIMNCPDEMEVDHIDGNMLNNCKSNLRICTHAQNVCNRLPSIGFTSKYKGVAWHSSVGRWQGYINFNKKRTYLGLFVSEKDAALAYNKKAIELHGQYAKLNVIKNEIPKPRPIGGSESEGLLEVYRWWYETSEDAEREMIKRYTEAWNTRKGETNG